MCYLQELIPLKYYGKTVNFNKFKKFFFYRKFLKNSKRILKDFLELDEDIFSEDKRTFSLNIFKSTDYDHIYEKNSLTPLGNERMVTILESTNFYKFLSLFLISNLIIEKNIKISGISTGEFVKIDCFLTNFKSIEEEYIDICKRKNLKNMLSIYLETKEIIEINLNKYYNNLI